MSTLSKQRQKNIAADVVIYERSLDSAVQVFQKTLEQDGTLSLMEVHTLTQLHSALLDTMPIADCIIYLRASPEFAFNRAKDMLQKFPCNVHSCPGCALGSSINLSRLRCTK